MKIHYTFIYLALFAITGCGQNKEPKAIARIGNHEITLDKVDATIQKELYVMLENIYLLRKQALNDLIGEKLLETEAKNCNISIDSLVAINVTHKISDSLLSAKANSFSGKIPLSSSLYQFADFKTEYGKQVLKQYVTNESRAAYIDQLREKYKNTIEVYLEEPNKFQPEIKFNNANIHFVDLEKKQNTIILIGNYECDNCKIAEPIIFELYEKYKKNFKLGFAGYDTAPSISMRCAESAALQGKYWEMHHKIMNHRQTLDSLNALKFASEINLNITQFKSDFSSKKVVNKISASNKEIESLGITQTPAIIINDKLYGGAYDKKSLESYLIKIINSSDVH